MDSRHGLKDSDRDMMTMLDKAAVVYQIVLTKVDKIKASELDEVSRRTPDEIKSRVAAHPSLINALTGRNTLARTSNTPGRTQELNFFNLGQRLILVDMPGYGFASAPKGLVEK